MRALAALALIAGCGGGGTAVAPAPGAPRAAEARHAIVYDVDRDGAVDVRLAAIAVELEARLGELGIVGAVRSSPAGDLTVAVEDPVRRAEAVKLIEAEYGGVLERRACDPADGPDAICAHVSGSHAAAVRDAALADAVATIRARLDHRVDATVVPSGDRIVVELPAPDPTAEQVARQLIARTGSLELKAVDSNSGYMKRLFAHVGSERKDGAPTDARAQRDRIRAEVDSWRPTAGGPARFDYYLLAPDRREQVSLDEARRIGCVGANAPELGPARIE